jgi:hypothetical protein
VTNSELMELLKFWIVVKTLSDFTVKSQDLP